MTIYFVLETLAKLIKFHSGRILHIQGHTNVQSIMVRDENKPLKIKINHDIIILLI